MLYVSGMSGKKYAVTDTDDNITELVSRTAIGKLICIHGVSTRKGVIEDCRVFNLGRRPLKKDFMKLFAIFLENQNDEVSQKRLLDWWFEVEVGTVVDIRSGYVMLFLKLTEDTLFVAKTRNAGYVISISQFIKEFPCKLRISHMFILVRRPSPNDTGWVVYKELLKDDKIIDERIDTHLGEEYTIYKGY